MRCAVLEKPGVLAVVGTEVPVPADGEVLVAVSAVGICGSDVHYWQHGRIGDFVVESPLILGHEASGRISSPARGLLDGAGNTLEEGDLVVLEPGIPCFACPECRLGRYNLCASMRFFGTPPVDGTLREYVCHPPQLLYKVPEGLGPDIAAMVEPLAVVVHALRKVRFAMGEAAVVTGAGPVGLLAVLALVRAGASRVTVIEPDEARRRLAASLGATAVQAAAGPGADQLGLHDVAIECSGREEAMAQAFALTGPGGRVALVGMSPTPQQSMSSALVARRELELHGIFRYANAHPAALALASAAAPTLTTLVSRHFPLERVEEAFHAAARHGPAGVKVIVDIGY
ncbi:MAG: alcohol dehydrogenase catalytic domain-containing protein [Acidimicrobiales bacterium]